MVHRLTCHFLPEQGTWPAFVLMQGSAHVCMWFPVQHSPWPSHCPDTLAHSRSWTGHFNLWYYLWFWTLLSRDLDLVLKMVRSQRFLDNQWITHLPCFGQRLTVEVHSLETSTLFLTLSWPWQMVWESIIQYLTYLELWRFSHFSRDFKELAPPTLWLLFLDDSQPWRLPWPTLALQAHHVAWSPCGLWALFHKAVWVSGVYQLRNGHCSPGTRSAQSQHVLIILES